MNKQGYVYILTNKPRGTLYIGVTSNLIKRIYQHKEKLVSGFTQKYELDQLVYFEIVESIESAIVREKQMKAWKRDWKIQLIEENNNEWVDLYKSLLN